MSLVETTDHPAPFQAEAPGSRPLKRASHERYARARARMFPMCEAAQLAGQSGRSGFCTKTEARRDVQDRIKWLTRQDEDTMHEGRREIEAFYWFALRSDPSRFFENGRLRAFEEMPEDYRQLIEGLTYTEKGKPNLKIVSKLAASIELRKLKGLDAPTKTDMTMAGGAVIQVVTGISRAPNEPEAV